jgi:hypothetical protein
MLEQRIGAMELLATFVLKLEIFTKLARADTSYSVGDKKKILTCASAALADCKPVNKNSQLQLKDG